MINVYAWALKLKTKKIDFENNIFGSVYLRIDGERDDVTCNYTSAFSCFFCISTILIIFTFQDP